MNLNSFQNLDAERVVLGSIICSNDVLPDVVDTLSPEDFYEQRNSIIYSTILKLYKSSKTIDQITILDDLDPQSRIKINFSYIAELVDAGGFKSTIKDYAEIIKQKSDNRKLKTMLESSLKDLETGNKKSDDIVENFISKTINQNKKATAITDEKLIIKTLNLIQTNHKNGGGILGIPTKIKTLDSAINGLQPEKLYIIAGRPAMGKSTLAINIYNSISSDKRFIYFTLEMADEEIGIKRLAMSSLIDSMRVERGLLSDDEWIKITNQGSHISTGKGLTDSTPDIGVGEIRAQCKKMQLQDGIDGLIIDHIGRMSMKGMGDNIREQTTNTYIQLKNIAKEFKIPVIVLSQLSRECEKRQDKRPVMRDLKESGGAEENADVILFLYRDEYYNPDSEKKGILEVNVAKQRGGRTGSIELIWMPQFQKIADISTIKGDGKS